MGEYIVYKHTSPSNKIYIGITMQGAKRRWRNGKGYSGNIYFTRAIEKYGWDNFQHEILYENLQKRQAEVLEISLIFHYKSNNPKYGYNQTCGGEVHLGHHPNEEIRRKLSESHKGEKSYWYGKNPWDYKTEEQKEQTKRKLSEAGKGRVCSEETKGKISKANKGNFHSKETKQIISEKAKERYENKENNPMYGKNHSEEARNKISIAKKGKKCGKDNPKSVKVICVTTKKIFNSIAEGANYYNIKNNTNISKCCKGKSKSCGKLKNGTPLVWRYLVWKHNKTYRKK